MSLSEISGAVGGAVTYATAGEISPRLTLENNRIISNCRQLYGNFSTCEAAIKIDVQNMQTFHFQVSLLNYFLLKLVQLKYGNFQPHLPLLYQSE